MKFNEQTKYLKWYFKIIEKHGRTDRTEKYLEGHHIFPKFAFGENAEIVFVSFRVHFLLHVLLWKHYKMLNHPLQSKAAFPLIRMKSPIKNQFGGNINSGISKMFHFAKIAAYEASLGENNPFYGKKHSAESRMKMSLALKGRKLTDSQKLAIKAGIHKMLSNEITGPIFRRKISEAGTGRIVSNETREKISRIHSGKKLSDETKQKISNSKVGKTLGVPKTEEHRKNISMGLKGLKKSKEHMEKINKNPEKIKKSAEKHRGMKRTLETCINISLSKIGKPAANKGGKYYYDPLTLKTCLIMPGESPPIGWINGLPRNKNAKNT